jgi:glucosamine--fructose-6-phosphate aminotransferase (isomerizing)
MHHDIHTVPELLRVMGPPADAAARHTLDFELCASVKRVSIVGCGDSHHAAVGAELAFKQLAGVPTRAFSALTFSRYEAGFLKPAPKTDLVIAISVSGSAARTVEALRLGQLAGAEGIAVTGAASSPLAQTAQRVFPVNLPPPPAILAGTHTPGVRSYAASQLAVYLLALRLGEVRGHLTTVEADRLRQELWALADIAEATIDRCESPAAEIAAGWSQSVEVVYVGAGPLYGTAMLSAAKMIEASGTPAMAQETEEWGHIQFFAEPAATPTILLDADGFSTGRAAEIAQAAAAIGRQVIVIAGISDQSLSAYASIVLPIAGKVRECFAPLVYFLPGALLAASMAQAVGAQYYRGFGGGRDRIERDIRSSQQVSALFR